MTNKEIASAFDLLAKVMELHNENPFKIKSYQNAYLTLRKLDKSLADYSTDELLSIKGIGEAIAEKIQSLTLTGSMPTLEKYLAKTPPGVVDMLKINGLGTKKVAILWKEHEITSPGELLYACNENRLVEWKGFGAKTQDSIIQAISFLQSNEGKYLHSTVQHHALQIIQLIHERYPDIKTEIVGLLRAGHSIVDQIELITTATPENLNSLENGDVLVWNSKSENAYEGVWMDFLPMHIHLSNATDLVGKIFNFSGPLDFISKYSLDGGPFSYEADIFSQNNKPYLSPEIRDISGISDWSESKIKKLISTDQIKGIIHCHSTYSDGIHTLKEMAKSAQKNGYEYLAITDHSRAAAYAKGMNEEKLHAQWIEVDELNTSFKSFRIIKGIECDILANGDLDYNDEILSGFELVIVSIHSAFQMDMDKATKRLIKAIENPFTNILGHPTGRLILTREGYPLDMSKIIDACSANRVAIELNSNPQRLDMDYKHIRECMDKGVLISINPDAHNQSAIHDIRYGVTSARKGMLESEFCLNVKDAEELLKFCKK